MATGDPAPSFTKEQLKGALKKNTGVSPAITRLDRAISIGPSCS